MNKKPDNSKAIATVIVVLIIFLFFKKCNSALDTAPSNQTYSTSQEWLDNNGIVKPALQAIVIDVIKQVERVEIDIDRRRFEITAINDGIKSDDYKYKYYYICNGQYTDKSNQSIHDFTIGVAFKNDAEMKEQSPYTILSYETK